MSNGVASQASAKRIAACDHVYVATFSPAYDACARYCGHFRANNPTYSVPPKLDLRRKKREPRRKKISLKKQWQQLCDK